LLADTLFYLFDESSAITKVTTLKRGESMPRVGRNAELGVRLCIVLKPVFHCQTATELALSTKERV